MDKSQFDVQSHPYDSYENEIELMDYLKVLWKWKYILLLGTFACALIAGIISFNMTKIYKVEMVVAPGVLKITEDGKRLYIDSLQNIQTMVEAGTFNAQILESLNKHVEGDPQEALDFNVDAPKGLNALRISYETANQKRGLQKLVALSYLLLEKFKNVVVFYQQEYDVQLGKKNIELGAFNSKISNAKAGIKTNEIRIQDLKQREAEVEREIERIGKNTELLISERNKFLSNKKTDDNILSALLYSNTIQVSIGYLNTLRDRTDDVKLKINNARLKIEKAQNDINDLESQKKLIAEEVTNIEFRKKIIQNIQILQPPQSSLSPIKPKKKLNVLLAGVIGLFLTVFLAFFIEYVSRHKDNEKDS